MEVAYLVVGGLITLGFGIVYLIRSARMAAAVGITIPSSSARADYRAIYGGAQVSIAVFLLIAAYQPAWREPGVAALALFAAGFGIARLTSLASEKAPREVQHLVGVLELAAGLAGLAILAL